MSFLPSETEATEQQKRQSWQLELDYQKGKRFSFQFSGIFLKELKYLTSTWTDEHSLTLIENPLVSAVAIHIQA